MLQAVVLGLILMGAPSSPGPLGTRALDPGGSPREASSQNQQASAQALEIPTVPEPTIEELLIQLERANGDSLLATQSKAFARFTQEVEAYHGWNAQRLAEGMHRRAQATWSAMTLALVCTRLGDSDRATRVLRSALEAEKDPVLQYELLERLGLAQLGAGKESAARGPLGSAFRRGSVNAGVVLGRIELRDGRMAQARAIFRTLLDKQPPPSWALRGWGLSMLPEPAAKSVPANPRTPVTPAP